MVISLISRPNITKSQQPLQTDFKIQTLKIPVVTHCAFFTVINFIKINPFT